MTDEEMNSLIKRNLECIKLCIEGKGNIDKDKMFHFSSDFTTPAVWTFNIYEEHLSFLKDISNVSLLSEIIDGDLLKRWRLANDLILLNFGQVVDIQPHVLNIKNQSLNLSCTILFPVLEEVARKISKYWCENGNMLKDSPDSIVFLDKKGKDKTYKKDDLIVNLSHKLMLMEYTLPDSLKRYMQRLSKAMEQQPIDGMVLEIPSLYKQFALERNAQLHGKKFSGNSALLVSLLIALLYLNLER